MPVRSADARSISTDQELWHGKGKGPGLSDQEDAKGEVKEYLAYLQGYLEGLRAANDPFDPASSRN